MKNAYRLSPGSGKLHIQLFYFFNNAETISSEISDPNDLKLVNDGLDFLNVPDSVQEWNDEYLKAHSDSTCVHAACQVMAMLDDSQVEAAADILLDVEAVELESAIAIHKTLIAWSATKGELFASRNKPRFPLASWFQQQ